jgi:hypothetical protein
MIFYFDEIVNKLLDSSGIRIVKDFEGTHHLGEIYLRLDTKLDCHLRDEVMVILS